MHVGLNLVQCSLQLLTPLPRVLLRGFLFCLKLLDALYELVQLDKCVFMIVLQRLMQSQNLIGLVLFLCKSVLPKRFILIKPLKHLVTLNADGLVVVICLLKLLVKFFDD
jgi:hypothetical protein